MQYIALELKIKRGALEQTAKYMDRCPAGAEGHFVLFNRDKGAQWDDKIWNRTEQYGGYTIRVWGM
jgi:hypothetical protein